MAGLEFRLKGSDSLIRKVEGIMDADLSLDPAAAAATIGDAPRYTMVAEADQLALVTQQALNDLFARGYHLGAKGIKKYGSLATPTRESTSISSLAARSSSSSSIPRSRWRSRKAGGTLSTRSSECWISLPPAGRSCRI